MTYNVFGGTLNLVQSISQTSPVYSWPTLSFAESLNISIVHYI